MDVSLCKRDGSFVKTRIKEINIFEGLGRIKVPKVQCGDICALIGIEGEIGDSIADLEKSGSLTNNRYSSSIFLALRRASGYCLYPHEGFNSSTSSSSTSSCGKRTLSLFRTTVAGLPDCCSRSLSRRMSMLPSSALVY